MIFNNNKIKLINKIQKKKQTAENITTYNLKCERANWNNSLLQINFRYINPIGYNSHFQRLRFAKFGTLRLTTLNVSV